MIVCIGIVYRACPAFLFAGQIRDSLATQGLHDLEYIKLHNECYLFGG